MRGSWNYDIFHGLACILGLGVSRKRFSTSRGKGAAAKPDVFPPSLGFRLRHTSTRQSWRGQVFPAKFDLRIAQELWKDS